MAATTGLTIEDFERLPAALVKNRELIDGELVDVSGNTPRHNLLRDRLLFLLLSWLAGRDLGTVIAEQEYDFLENAHGPDVSFFGKEKQALLTFDKRVQRFVPDLAIEIASLSDTYDAFLRKKERYRRAGTAEVWLISAENREIAVYGPGGDRILKPGDVLKSEVLAGIEIEIAKLFQDL